MCVFLLHQNIDIYFKQLHSHFCCKSKHWVAQLVEHVHHLAEVKVLNGIVLGSMSSSRAFFLFTVVILQESR